MYPKLKLEEVHDEFGQRWTLIYYHSPEQKIKATIKKKENLPKVFRSMAEVIQEKYYD